MTRLIALLVVLLSAHAAVAQAKLLRIGVRNDATSMSFLLSPALRKLGEALPGPLAERGYGGYVVHICDRVLIDLQRTYGRELTIEVVPLKAFEVFPALEARRVDIICGPTTATRDRLHGRISSPPVFVSGVTFASRPPNTAQPCQPLVGYLKSSTAGSGSLNRILENGEWPNERRVLESFVSGDAGWKEFYKDCPGEVAPIAEYDTHDELAQAFCDDRLRHYVGDFEIVTRTLQAQRATLGKACDYIVSDNTFSEERYVILGTARPDDDSENPIVAHFFEILSRQVFFQPSVLDDAFKAAFPLSRPSRKLELLFWALRGNKE